jgi:Leucine-rich repeat (LRR) protein
MMRAYVVILFFSLILLIACGGESDKPQTAQQADSTVVTEDTATFKPDTVLNLANKELEEVPENIEAYQKVHTVDLSGNPGLNLTATFVALAKLPNLHTLIMKSNNIDSLPPDIGYLGSLKVLDFSANNLKRLPQEFGMLQQLEELKLSFNQIDSFPMAIVKLRNLRILEISDNYIKNMPDSIGFLTNLTKLIISKNEIPKIPLSIGNLKKMEMFDISKNLVNTVPATIANLVNLVYLDFSSNELESLPATFVKFNNRPLQLYLEKNMFDEKAIESIKKMLPNSAITFGD